MKQSISFFIDCYAPSLLRLALPLIARVTLSRQTIDFLERLAIPELEDENPSRQKQGDTIREADLGPALEMFGPADERDRGRDLALREARDLFERRFILSKLREHGGNVKRTAEALNIERSHLYRKMKSYGIDPGDVAVE